MEIALETSRGTFQSCAHMAPRRQYSAHKGKHHCILRLESYQMSVIPFLRPKRLKEELNDQFRAMHPWTQVKGLSLSKLRNLRFDLLRMTDVIPSIDVSTVSLAWVYFEKLVLLRHVDKSNRKLLAGVCLVLACKFHHDTNSSSLFLKDLKKLYIAIRAMDRKDRLNVTDIRKAEVVVFCRLLEFHLHIPPSECQVVLHRMLEMKDTDFLNYYGRTEEYFANLVPD